jgi:hypothetical protein
VELDLLDHQVQLEVLAQVVPLEHQDLREQLELLDQLA